MTVIMVEVIISRTCSSSRIWEIKLPVERGTAYFSAVMRDQIRDRRYEYPHVFPAGRSRDRGNFQNELNTAAINTPLNKTYNVG